jgi:hypothetical protein
MREKRIDTAREAGTRDASAFGGVARPQSRKDPLMQRACIALLLAAASACASAQVGVSVSVNQPGVYGRIDIGNLPPAMPAPVLVYPQPVVIVPGPVAVHQRPIYLHVPPGHEKHWAKHCAQYNACGQPVYFVRDDWYREHYVHHVPGRKYPNEHHDHDHDHDRDHDHGHGKGHGKAHR